MGPSINREQLEALYDRYNRREFVHPDPLEFLYRYENPHDREIVGLIASSLAYGRVVQILRSVRSVLERMPSPARFLKRSSAERLRDLFADFRHRFTSADDLVLLLLGIKQVRENYGSLYRCFQDGLGEADETVLPAMKHFAAELRMDLPGNPKHFVPCPEKGSACKRLNLFLRWMVRHDEVDPGGWEKVPRSKLIVPLDTHMYRICKELRFTSRKSANMYAAAEITQAFKKIAPDDPVRYDFALTRLGIRNEREIMEFLSDYREIQ